MRLLRHTKTTQQLWDPALEMEDCKLHSNSYGSNSGCVPDPSEILLDEFMYQVSGPIAHKVTQCKTANRGAYIVHIKSFPVYTSRSEHLRAIQRMIVPFTEQGSKNPQD